MTSLGLHTPALFEDAFIEACLDDEHPLASRAARYLSEARLLSLLGELRALVLEAPSAPRSLGRESTSSLLRGLLERKLVVRVGDAPKSRDTPYWLKIRGGVSSSPNPYELATSIAEGAIVSDISALRYWGLNEFVATEEFVRIPTRAPSTVRTGDSSTRPKPRLVRNETELAPESRSKRGTVRFVAGDVAFRSRELAPSQQFGVRFVHTDDRERIAIVTLERALLMALRSPHTNGETRGVLAAWERAADDFSVDALLDGLRRGGRGIDARRVAALSERVGRTDAVDAALALIANGDVEDDGNVVPLFAGASFTRESKRFRVTVPW